MRNLVGLTALSVIFAAAGSASANIAAKATIAQTGTSPNAYAITVNNTGSETIETFWYSWIPSPFLDFLKSSPTVTNEPSGWFAPVENEGPEDGFSIFNYTFSNGIAPGSSMTFSFTSPDDLATLLGPSYWYQIYNTGTSFIYTGFEAGDQAQIIVTAAPEPAGVGLLGAAGALVLGRRRRNV